MKQHNSISTVIVLCAVAMVVAIGAAAAWDVERGNLLVLSNEAGTRGVYSYSYNSTTGRYEKGTEHKFIDLSAFASAGDITYGPDNNLYVTLGNVVKRCDGYTGAYIDDYVTGLSSVRNVAFSPSGKAYVDSGKNVFERQPNGSMSQYFSGPSGATFIYRMAWGPDNSGDNIQDLYLITNKWATGVFMVRQQGDAGLSFAMPPTGYGLYEALAWGPDKTGDGFADLFTQGGGAQVTYHNGDTGAYVGYFAPSIGAYAADVAWGPDGKLYVANRTHGRVEVYSSSGSFLYNFYVAGASTGANRAYALAFVPESESVSPLVIAQSGSAAADIVVPASPSDLENFAAQSMASCLNKITGGTFEIISDTGGPYTQPVISIGRTSLATGLSMQGEAWMQESREAFRILRRDNALIICGNQSAGAPDYGTLWGVYAFLEMQGVGQYLPDPLGDVFPSIPTLTIDQLDVTEAPAFETRNTGDTIAGLLAQTQQPRDVEWLDREGASRRVEYFPMYQDVITPAVRAAHPEWFVETLPDIGVDLTRPEIRNLFIQHLANRFSQNPDLNAASIAPDDYTLSNRCWSAEYLRQLGLSAPPSDPHYGTQSASDLHISFVNGVAEGLAAQFPDRKLITYARIDYIDPPTVTQVHPNVIVMISPSEDTRRDELHPSLQSIIQGWKNMGAQKLYWYGSDLGRTPSPNLVGEWFRYHKRSGVEGACYEFAPASAVNGLNRWLTSKLLWNPDADVAKLTDLFCAGLFGPEVGDLMRQFFVAWDAKPPVVHEAVPQLLSAATAMAGSPSSVVGKRVRLFKLGYDLYRSSLDLDSYLKVDDIPKAAAAVQSGISALNALLQEYPGWGIDPNIRLYNGVSPSQYSATTLAALQQVMTAAEVNHIPETQKSGSALCLTNNTDVPSSQRLNTGVTVAYSLQGGDQGGGKLFDGVTTGSDHVVVKSGSWKSVVDLDFKGTYQIDRVEICTGMTTGYAGHQRTNGTTPISIDIQVSRDKLTWTAAARILPRTLRGWVSSDKLLATARYIKITTYGVGTDHEYDEIKVWGRQ